MVSIKGHFEGSVFVPDEPVELPQNQPVVIHVLTESESKPKGQAGGFLKTLDSLIGSVNMPSDWASEHDHYLYGTPKRGEKKD